MLESEATTCTTIEGDDTKARFNIASCLAHSFKGLPDAVETCLHQASKTGNCSTVIESRKMLRLIEKQRF